MSVVSTVTCDRTVDNTVSPHLGLSPVSSLPLTEPFKVVLFHNEVSGSMELGKWITDNLSSHAR